MKSLAECKRRTEEHRRHNKRTYTQYPFRVRKGTPLDLAIKSHIEYGELSLNFVITQELCKIFNCPLPHREYTRTIRTPIC